MLFAIMYMPNLTVVFDEIKDVKFSMNKIIIVGKCL